MKQKYLIHCQVGLLFLHVFPKAYMHIMTNKQFGGNELGESKHSQMLMYFRKKYVKLRNAACSCNWPIKKETHLLFVFHLKFFCHTSKRIFLSRITHEYLQLFILLD